MSHTKQELVRYRVERAKEALADAGILMGQKRWNATANRMYYACYYAVSAYLALKDLKPATHAGLKSSFNLELVKAGKVSKEDGLLFNKLFGMRQEADYEDFVKMEENDVAPLMPKIEGLIGEMEGLIDMEGKE